MTRGRRPAPGDRDAALDVAVRLLGARPRSEPRLRALLAGRGFTEEVVDDVMARLRELRYLDDAALARSRAVALLESGRFGEAAVEAKLLALGLEAPEVRRALAQAREEVAVDSEASARALLGRRRQRSGSGPPGAKARARDCRYLVGRGFPEPVARKVAGLEDTGDGDDGGEPA